jgi:hypothetical protein
MTSVLQARGVIALVVLLALGCSRNRDPHHIDIGDFDSGQALTDTLRKLLLPGIRVAAASEMMQRNGFICGDRAGTIVDLKTGKLGSGKPDLQCWQSSRIPPGFQRRDWTVTFKYDTSGIRDVFANFIIQP